MDEKITDVLGNEHDLNKSSITENSQIVTFYLNKDIYAFDIIWIKEIIDLPKIEKIPKTPDFLEGIYSLRGEVIPIISLAKRFRLEEKEHSSKRVIICNIDNIKIGFIVDDVDQVRSIKGKTIQPPPAALDAVGEKYITGVIKENTSNIILLNLQIILSFDIGDVSPSG